MNQNSKGKVTSGSDGYTTPQDLNNDNTFDFRDENYDVGCYNPSLQVVKSAVVSDTNSNGLTDVGDVINYTVVVTNTGEIPILLTSLEDKLTIGSTLQTVTLEWSSSSTETFLGPNTNFYTYSNNIDDGSTNNSSIGVWARSNNNMQGLPGNASNRIDQDGYPPGIPYYFSTDSGGTAYTDVDSVFPTDGFGTTTPTYLNQNTDYKVSRLSLIHI